MPIFFISLVVQVLLVVHIVKTGRNTTWIWIVVMLPGAGAIAYAVVEVLPDLVGSRSGRKAVKGIEKVVNPNKDIHAATRDFAMSETIENSLKLAQEFAEKGLYGEAKTLYERSLRGIHEHDPEIMYRLADVEFKLDNAARTKQLLDELIDKNPDYKNQEAHLLFARTLERLGDIAKARCEYEVLVEYFLGAEVKYRFAMLLRAEGESARAEAMLMEIVAAAKTSGKHFRQLNSQWIALAKRELGK